MRQVVRQEVKHPIDVRSSGAAPAERVVCRGPASETASWCRKSCTRALVSDRPQDVVSEDGGRERREGYGPPFLFVVLPFFAQPRDGALVPSTRVPDRSEPLARRLQQFSSGNEWASGPMRGQDGRECRRSRKGGGRPSATKADGMTAGASVEPTRRPGGGRKRA